MGKNNISYDDTPAAKFNKEFQENAIVTVTSDGGWHSDVDVTAVDSLISCAYDHLEKEAGESCDCKTVQENDGIHYYMYAEGYIGDVEALIDSGKMSLRAKEGSEEMKLPDGNTYDDLEHYSLYEVKRLMAIAYEMDTSFHHGMDPAEDRDFGNDKVFIDAVTAIRQGMAEDDFTAAVASISEDSSQEMQK